MIFSADKLATLPSAGSAGAPSGGPGGGDRKTVFLDPAPQRALYRNADAIHQAEAIHDSFIHAPPLQGTHSDGGAAIVGRAVYVNVDVAVDVADPAAPSCLHAQITSREQAEALLREQPAHPDRLYYLVRPRGGGGVPGSYALGMFARGTCL